MNYTYSVDKNGTIYRLHTEDDPDPKNPREDDDGNIGTMYCEHSRYKLGDETDLESKLDMKYRMIEDAGVPIKKVIEAAKNGKFNNISLSYYRKERAWNLYTRKRNGEMTLTERESSLCFLEEDIIDYLSVQEIVAFLKSKLFALPLFLYEHSGICISTSDFCDTYDSGQVGWIWTTREKVERLCGKKNITDEEIILWLRGEVELYSQYLEGECYGYIEEKYEMGEWEEIDSSWGYYPKTADSLSEISDEVFGTEKWTYDEPVLPEPVKIIGDRIRSMSNDELQDLMDLVVRKTLEQIRKHLTGEELLKLLLSECSSL